ncbi:unnamed protein product [Phyllotreta striolata]|uniref:Ig-like domain-containing protein n=1 Tax=Phyllotreta striolata TaxID=444603 RepID=A0A9N9TSL6_PHYSR|nr:unnamed protein product [Phyllotreta striolata]
MAIKTVHVNHMTFYALVLFIASEAVTQTSWMNKSENLRIRRSYETRRGKDHSYGNSLKIPPSGRATTFFTDNSTTVVAQIGGTAKLPCVVRKSNNAVVSWIRKNVEPPAILTVGVGTYIADDRFLVEHARHLQNWGLVIKHVRPEDAGVYECQISTHPTSSIFLELKVTEAVAIILGAPDLYIKAGSVLRLQCNLLHATEAPAYVFWYHEQKMVNHDPGVMVNADKTSSVFQLDEADTRHSGNYTCYPSNTIPAYVTVHVLNATEEENPAAMLHANTSDISTRLDTFFLVFVNILLIVLDR